MVDAQHPYPVQWIDRWHLKNGETVTVRPVLPQDQHIGQDFVAHGLTARSRYLRFQIGLHDLPTPIARYFTDIDYHDHFALVAEHFGAAGHVQVGEARFVRDRTAADAAEFAIAVADTWQGLGLGHRLLQTTMAAARSDGVLHLYGDVLRDNEPMLGLCKALGFAPHVHPDDARLVRLRRELEQPPTVALTHDTGFQPAPAAWMRSEQYGLMSPR